MQFKWCNRVVSLIQFFFKTHSSKINCRARNYNKAQREFLKFKSLSPFISPEIPESFLKVDDSSKFLFCSALIFHKINLLCQITKTEYILTSLKQGCDVFHIPKYEVEACTFLEKRDSPHTVQSRFEGSFDKGTFRDQSIDFKYYKRGISFSQLEVLSSFQILFLDKKHPIIFTGKG